ncbi:dockerin type I domain-containing protein [Herbivorax sp. ANBcel31]|uniref:dockerin type I domain-containing protein n=1 Tax=Herbivorax sp. ANBcel31 TaxID=3069754 RepID=UPI0027AF042E|nr:dockerin type I domain-containing protein [Herbivorax sp. ANBcel31]MDQ2085629.1 dockerin type I domain-containing protein [Herbivorax sp. ANBcel31]
MKTVKLFVQTTIVLLIVICVSLSAYAIQYKYDDLNRLVEVMYDSGQRVTYTYDAGGNILSVQSSAALMLDSIGDKTVEAGQLLEFTVTASTEEETELEYSVHNLPEGSEFNNLTNTFAWVPESTQSGIYENIQFEVTDGTYVASEEITITVKGDVNTLPGENVEVLFENNISVTFENVIEAGETSISVYDNLPEETYFDVNLIPGHYDIVTTAEFEGEAEVKIYFDIEGFEEFQEDLRLYQIKDGNITDITKDDVVNVDESNICYIKGVIEHFCFFSVGIPNRAPVADAGSDKVVEANLQEGAEIELDGSLSFDPDANLKGFERPSINPDGRNIVSYKWNGPFGEIEGVNPTVILPIGTWECKLTVSDGWIESSDIVTITVQEEIGDILYGDLNGDGVIDSSDLVLLKRHILKIITEFPVENGEVLADLNGDGDIDSTDYTLLQRYVLEKIDKFPVE